MREMVHSYQTRMAQVTCTDVSIVLIGATQEGPTNGETVPVETQVTNGKKKESHAEAELRRDLKKARHQLKQYEGKIKAIEEEHKQAVGRLVGEKGFSPKPEVGLRAQLDLVQKQMEKERVEYKKRADRLEEEWDTSRTEANMLRRDLEEAHGEKASLVLQLEGCRAEMKRVEVERPVHQVGLCYYSGW